MAAKDDGSAWRRELVGDMLPVMQLLGHFCDVGDLQKAADQLDIAKVMINKARVRREEFELSRRGKNQAAKLLRFEDLHYEDGEKS